MRIIAGQWRGRRILGPPDDQTRPMLDRVKTILFDMLGSRLARPGYLPPIAVLDLFSGTGTLGLEALSRGARFCRFVEQRRATAAVLRANLDALGVIREAEVIEGDATGVSLHAPPSEEGQRPMFELVFIDPPFAVLSRPQVPAPFRRLLGRLATGRAVADDALIVVRHPAGPRPPDLSPLIEQESRVVGRMVLRLFYRPPPGSDWIAEIEP